MILQDVKLQLTIFIHNVFTRKYSRMTSMNQLNANIEIFYVPLHDNYNFS